MSLHCSESFKLIKNKIKRSSKQNRLDTHIRSALINRKLIIIKHFGSNMTE